MELFSEIYGCYFNVVSRILDQTQTGMTKSEIEKLVKEGGFYDSAFHLLPALFSNEWSLLNEKDNVYYSRLINPSKRSLTILEKSWLKALTEDPRIQLFLDAAQLAELRKSLSDVPPLYLNSDFHIYDKHLDGDAFENPDYILRFKVILKAIQEQIPLVIEYDSAKGSRSKRRYHPYKLCYSPRDDKFRLQCAAYSKRSKRLKRIMLNLARIISVQTAEPQFDIRNKLDALFKEAICTDPVVLELSKERNALERCMLQFASFERQTEYDREQDRYKCRIWFNSDDETELLIRILSFGPVVKVLGPDHFLQQIKERIKRQMEIHI